MRQVLSPRESSEFIIKNSKHVKINPKGIENLTQEVIKGIQDKRIDVNNFSQHDLHPKPTDDFALDWIFMVDTLNFCFWTPTNYTKYKVMGHTGYFALCAAINRAMKDVNITNAAYYNDITLDAVRHIFRSDDGETVMPLLEERVKCLHQVGQKLLEKWNGKFENVVKAAKCSALRLLKIIVEEFPSFRDESDYCGQRVSFYKRAQILVGDVWACFKGEGLGYFTDLNSITMFADYRVPQVLVHFGSLQYDDQLMKILKSDQVLKNGDPMEIEIRGASIYIVEQVKDRIIQEFRENPIISKDRINSILIDHFLWDYRRLHAEELEHIPFHKVLCIYY